MKTPGTRFSRFALVFFNFSAPFLSLLFLMCSPHLLSCKPVGAPFSEREYISKAWPEEHLHRRNPVENTFYEARARLAVLPDGELTAHVLTPAGVFERSVRVADGSVECINWTVDRCSTFFGAMVENGKTFGTTAHGEVAEIRILE